jgi:hypothetical protein
LDPTVVPGRERQGLLASRATKGLLFVSLGAALACDTPPDDLAHGGSGGAGGVAANHVGGSTASHVDAGSSGGTSARVSGTAVTALGTCNTSKENWNALGASNPDCPASTACDLEQALGLIPNSCVPSTAYHLYIDANGTVADVIASDGSAISATMKQCIIDTLSNEQFPCLSGHEVWATTPIIIL